MIQFNEPVSAAKVRDGFYKGDGKRKDFSVSKPACWQCANHGSI